MRAGCSQLKAALLVFIAVLCFYALCGSTEPQVCNRCDGTVLNGTEVERFCSRSAGQIQGRCCLTNDNTTDSERIIGLDLSNCSLTCVEDLHEAATAFIIDLSHNPIVNLSDTVFEGFTELNYMILPADVACPGGNESWLHVELREGNCLCEGQRNMCNQTGQLSVDCPESSLCAPYGPGLVECSCADSYHGYKCLRQGEFPALKVFLPLGASTVAISILLWVTQRRKAKSQ